ncbi:MAG TPA: Gfo/Idh/MocA family oxidoreductase [Hyphomicrobiaceae bacterium]|nr:Gfo/Idh/MocA family oxidoreductase [Hyphomicrobiaceae bacterium]
MTDARHDLARAVRAATNRRRFLQSLGTGILAPLVLPGSVLGRDDLAAPSERITVGIIGTGNQGNQHIRILLGMPDVRIVAVCDPVRAKREAARQKVDDAYAQERRGASGGCTACADFRELAGRSDIDAVFVASPEHWHALHGIAALRAGMDLYVEKALTTTIAEGRALVETARRYGRVVQVGTQQRSSGQFRLACELARNGYLGKLETIRVGDPRGYPGPPIRDVPVPEGLDYDLWLGPAPWKPYFPERLVNLKGWMLTYDYTVGVQSGWGQHDIDIAQWGNGTDHTGPIEIEGHAVFPSDGLNDTAMTWHTEYLYANGVRLIFTSDNENPHGIRFEGTEGSVFVNRGGIWSQPESLVKVHFKSGDVRLYESNNHHANFLDCVKTRRDPVSPIEAGHHANVICNLSDIAARLGRKLRWDPAKERFTDDDQANRMRTRAMRAPWKI